MSLTTFLGVNAEAFQELADNMRRSPLSLAEVIERNSVIRRGTMLVNALSEPEANLMPLDYTEAAWWVAIARETLDGQRSLDLHALIAGTVPAETLHYVATGVQS